MYHHKNGLILQKLDSTDLDLLKKLKDESWFGTHTVSIINNADQRRWFETTKAIVLLAQLDRNAAMRMLPGVDGCPKIAVFKIDGINYVNRVCDVGWDVFSEHRGKGFGKMIVEAGVDFCFEILNLNRLNAEILENNLASQRCAISAGFLKEGNKRKSVHKCGEYLDSYCYGILSEEWTAHKKSRFGDAVCNQSYLPKNSH